MVFSIKPLIKRLLEAAGATVPHFNMSPEDLIKMSKDHIKKMDADDIESLFNYDDMELDSTYSLLDRDIARDAYVKMFIPKRFIAELMVEAFNKAGKYQIPNGMDKNRYEKLLLITAGEFYRGAADALIGMKTKVNFSEEIEFDHGDVYDFHLVGNGMVVDVEDGKSAKKAFNKKEDGVIAVVNVPELRAV